MEPSHVSARGAVALPSFTNPGHASASDLLVTFVFYWWHRWRHESEFLWVAFHQVHHSPARLEAITSFYKSPLEIVADSVIVALIQYTVLGLGESHYLYTAAYSVYGEFLYHMNVRTPVWLGYFVQRPEAHRVHHLRDSQCECRAAGVKGRTVYPTALSVCRQTSRKTTPICPSGTFSLGRLRTPNELQTGVQCALGFPKRTSFASETCSRCEMFGKQASPGRTSLCCPMHLKWPGACASNAVFPTRTLSQPQQSSSLLRCIFGRGLSWRPRTQSAGSISSLTALRGGMAALCAAFSRALSHVTTLSARRC